MQHPSVKVLFENWAKCLKRTDHLKTKQRKGVARTIHAARNFKTNAVFGKNYNQSITA